MATPASTPPACLAPINMDAVVGKPAGPCAMVIFGGTGDLAERKLFPSLANLARDRLLPESFAVLGVATRPWSVEQFREYVAKALDEFAGGVDGETRQWLVERVDYLSGDFSNDATFTQLKDRLKSLHQRHQTGGNTLYYLATSPRFFSEIPRRLAAQGLAAQEEQAESSAADSSATDSPAADSPTADSPAADSSASPWRRFVIEKPFGVDLESARQLNRELWEVVSERQVYRIDHYLGKETVQNILAFRFANGIFEPTWNHHYIDHVQISASESIGVEQRGRYYDQSGALRDMLPNHLFQLLTLTAMEPPSSFDADAVRDEQVKVLKAIEPLSAESVARDAIRGQYASGAAGELAYRDEEHVPDDSNTPTFVALKLRVDNWRWSGVPFYLRTGKRLPWRSTEVAIRFRRAPFALFRGEHVKRVSDNWLVLRLQPEEGISLSFGAKVPGAVMRLGDVTMDFSYQDYFGTKLQTGYERLLYDCMLGDATLFQRSDMVETSWKVVRPILERWESETPDDFPNYSAGHWGPPAADQLLARDGREWRNCQ